MQLKGPLRIIVFPDVSHRKNEDGSSQRGMTVFLAESRERSSKDGMSYGSLVDYESQKIKKIVLSTTVAELFSFMRCFGSCQFLSEIWMDMSGEVANIHMRTDAMNLVTIARTIHLPEQKETIHMISMMRKDACSGSIHDLAHIPNQNCLTVCLTKASAKADNWITVVKAGRFSDVDIHPNFKTLMEHKAFLSTLCAPTPREEPFHVMFVRSHAYFENQDGTKITSALADSRIYLSRTMVSLLLRTLCLRLVLMTFFSVFHLFSQLCDHALIKTNRCWQSKQMDTEFC